MGFFLDKIHNLFRNGDPINPSERSFQTEVVLSPTPSYLRLQSEIKAGKSLESLVKEAGYQSEKLINLFKLVGESNTPMYSREVLTEIAGKICFLQTSERLQKKELEAVQAVAGKILVASSDPNILTPISKLYTKCLSEESVVRQLQKAVESNSASLIEHCLDFMSKARYLGTGSAFTLTHSSNSNTLKAAVAEYSHENSLMLDEFLANCSHLAISLELIVDRLSLTRQSESSSIDPLEVLYRIVQRWGSYVAVLDIDDAGGRVVDEILCMTPNLRELHLSDTLLQRLPAVQKLSRLEGLNIVCPLLEELTGVQHLVKLKFLDIAKCKCLTRLPSISSLKLERLSIPPHLQIQASAPAINAVCANAIRTNLLAGLKLCKTYEALIDKKTICKAIAKLKSFVLIKHLQEVVSFYDKNHYHQLAQLLKKIAAEEREHYIVIYDQMLEGIPQLMQYLRTQYVNDELMHPSELNRAALYIKQGSKESFLRILPKIGTLNALTSLLQELVKKENRGFFKQVLYNLLRRLNLLSICFLQDCKEKQKKQLVELMDIIAGLHLDPQTTQEIFDFAVRYDLFSKKNCVALLRLALLLKSELYDPPAMAMIDQKVQKFYDMDGLLTSQEGVCAVSLWLSSYQFNAHGSKFDAIDEIARYDIPFELKLKIGSCLEIKSKPAGADGLISFLSKYGNKVKNLSFHGLEPSRRNDVLGLCPNVVSFGLFGLSPQMDNRETLNSILKLDRVERIWLEGSPEVGNDPGFIHLGTELYRRMIKRNFTGFLSGKLRVDFNSSLLGDLHILAEEVLKLDLKLLLHGLDGIQKFFCKEPGLLRSILVKMARAIPADYDQAVRSRSHPLRNLLSSCFPVNKPENSELYPVHAEESDNQHTIRSTIYAPALQTGLVLQLIASFKSKMENVRIEYYGQKGVDGGGLERQFWAEMGAGFANGFSLGALSVVPGKGKYLPVLTRFEGIFEEQNALMALGHIFAYLIEHAVPHDETAVPKYPFGDIFADGLFDVLTELSLDEISKSFTEFIQDATPLRWVQLYRLLADENEQEIVSQIHSALTEPKLDSLKALAERLAALGLADPPDSAWIPVLQETIFDAYKGAMMAKIVPVQMIACGIYSYFPIMLLKNPGSIALKNWEELKSIHEHDNLSKIIQGTVSKDRFLHLLQIERGKGVEAEKELVLRKWTEEWVLSQPDDLRTIKNLIRAVTGSSALGGKIKFKLYAFLTQMKEHTCFSMLDVPHEVSKEHFHAYLDSLGGEGVVQEFNDE